MKRFLCSLPCVGHSADAAEAAGESKLSTEQVRRAKISAGDMHCAGLPSSSELSVDCPHCDTTGTPPFPAARVPTPLSKRLSSWPALIRCLLLQATGTEENLARPRISQHSPVPVSEQHAQAPLADERAKDPAGKTGGALQKWWTAPALAHEVPKPQPKVPELRVDPLEPGGPPVRVGVVVRAPCENPKRQLTERQVVANPIRLGTVVKLALAGILMLSRPRVLCCRV